MDVIPSLNCADIDTARAILGRFRELGRRGSSVWIHLDIADARFTFNRTWGDPLSWPIFGKGFLLEVHLMVESPEQLVEPWLQAGAKRVIVHIEALEENRFRPRSEESFPLLYAMRDICAAHEAELILGINADTDITRCTPYLGFIKHFLVLAVQPGLPGQRFLPAARTHVQWLRKEMPHAIIEVDGGVTPEVVAFVREAGADRVVSASFLLHYSKGVRNAMQILENGQYESK